MTLHRMTHGSCHVRILFPLRPYVTFLNLCWNGGKTWLQLWKDAQHGDIWFHRSTHQRRGRALQNHDQDTKDDHSWIWYGWLFPDIIDKEREQFVLAQPYQSNLRRSCLQVSGYPIWVLTCFFSLFWAFTTGFATCQSQTNPPSMNFRDTSTLRCAHALGSTMFPSQNCAARWVVPSRAWPGRFWEPSSGPGTEGGTIYHTRPRQRSVKMKETWLLSSKWSSKKSMRIAKKQGVARDSFFVCMDWQRYSKRFYEDIQDIWVLFAFFLFQIAVSGERDHWKDLSKYFENLRANMERKDSMQSRAEGFFLKSRPLGKKESRRDKLAKSKRAKIGVHSFAWFICQLSLGNVNLLTCCSFAVLDSVLIRDRRAITIGVTTCHNGNTQIWLNFVEQNSPTGHTIFTGQTTQLGAPWRSLSLRQARGTCHIQQSNIQHGNLPTHTHSWIDRGRQFF